MLASAGVVMDAGVRFRKYLILRIQKQIILLQNATMNLQIRHTVTPHEDVLQLNIVISFIKF